MNINCLLHNLSHSIITQPPANAFVAQGHTIWINPAAKGCGFGDFNLSSSPLDLGRLKQGHQTAHRIPSVGTRRGCAFHKTFWTYANTWWRTLHCRALVQQHVANNRELQQFSVVAFLQHPSFFGEHLTSPQHCGEIRCWSVFGCLYC